MLTGHKAAWAIFDTKGKLLTVLSCLYDSNDFLSETAMAWEIDYENKNIRITREFTQ